MIVRVWGEINGVGSVPIISVGDKYYFKTPPTLTGRYTCQFWAEDDYGNIANEVAILTIFEGIVRCIEVVTREWSVTMLSESWRVDMEPECWDVKMVPLNCNRDMLEVV